MREALGIDSAVISSDEIMSSQAVSVFSVRTADSSVINESTLWIEESHAVFTLAFIEARSNGLGESFTDTVCCSSLGLGLQGSRHASGEATP